MTYRMTINLCAAALLTALAGTALGDDKKPRTMEELKAQGFTLSTPATSTPPVSPPTVSAPTVVITTQTEATVQLDPLTNKAQGAQPAALPSIKVADTAATAYGWAMILSKYVKPVDATGLARFDYGALKANESDRQALKDYISDLEDADPNGFSAAEATAFWANLYNAVTVDVVTENYPVKSIREIKSGWRAGPWKRKLVTVMGENLSLDDIEHDILREQFPSPLVHYMVNCASVGCPNLISKPWSAKTLDTDREAAARAFINSSRGVEITDAGLNLSSIYKWFKEDFGSSRSNVLAHIREYADADLAAAIDGGAKIKGYDYNWSLND